MEQRADFIMNSISIQKTFPKVYQDFFSRCPIVCSVPRVHAITGDHTVPYGGVMMAQRAPWRNYAGLELLTKEVVELVPRIHVPDTSFIDHDFSRIFEERVVSVVLDFLRTAGTADCRGVRIHVLTEGPPPRISGGYGGISAALACALHLATGAAQPETLARWAHMPTSQLLTDTSLTFDPIFRYALRLKSAFDLLVDGGGLVFTSLCSSISPTLFFWQKSFHEMQDIFPFSFRRASYEQILGAIPHIPYWGMQIEDIVAEQTHAPFGWPIDFLTINLGKVVSAGYAKRMSANLEERFRHFSDELDKSFAPLIKHGDPLPPFYHFAKAHEGQNIWDLIPTFSMKLAFTTISRFLGVFSHGVGEEAINHFLRAADTYWHWINIMDFDMPIQNHLANQLHDRAAHLGIPIAVKPYAYGGEVLVMSPLATFREPLIEEITKFSTAFGVRCTLDWATWRDGFERQGLRVDQHCAKGINASFLGGDVAFIHRWDIAGHFEKLRLSHDRLSDEATRADIFLDVEEKKIFVKGKALTSRELHSSTKAIEIMTALLEAGGAWVPSEQLPQSSYIDRNEMQSKIVSPLRAIIKRRCKKELPLDIKGSVGAHFTMRFNPRGFTIALRVAS